jgi:hypothetical protein
MKRVITQGVLEDAKYFCDKHPKRECFSELKTASWYGSVHDLTGVEIHLCDECLTETFVYLEQTFGVRAKEIEI